MPRRTALRKAFDDAHEARYGYRDEQAEIELVNLRVSVWGRRPGSSRWPRPRPGVAGPRGDRVRGRAGRGEPDPGRAGAGQRLEGPALCALAEATLLVPPGWSGEVDRHGRSRCQRGGRG